MPEFELDLTNVESEEVDGITVIKAAEVTAVSLVGLSADEAAANLHANAAALGAQCGDAQPRRETGDAVGHSRVT